MKRSAAAVLLALAATWALPAVAPAAKTAGPKTSIATWTGPGGLAIAPDGRTLYAGGDQRSVTFAVNAATGALAEISDSDPPGGPVVISPDSRFVYIASGTVSLGAGISVLSRDPATGLLLHLATIMTSGPLAESVGAVSSLAMSSDGRSLYAIRARDDPSILVFDRSPASGAIALSQTIFADATAPTSLNSPFGIAVSGDDRSVLTAGTGSVTAFTRDANTGRLTLNPSPPCTCSGGSSAFAVAVSPDGTRVYAGSNDIESYSRDTSTGTITRLSSTYESYSCGVTGDTVAVSPDGRLVVAGDARIGGIRVGIPNDTGLGDVRTYPVVAARRVGGLVWSPDGRFLFVAAESGGSGVYCSNLVPDSAITVFRRDGDTLTQASVVHPVVRSYSGYQAGVSIANGALYTNTLDVTLTITPPIWLPSSVMIANDGSFAGGSLVRVSGPISVPWHLEGGADERTVRHVYLRFTGNERQPPLNLGDDIVLDTHAPTISNATSVRRSLTISAHDTRSGVAAIQLAARRAAPNDFKPFAAHLRLAKGSNPRWVRVRDRAGNVSTWTQIRRRR